MLPATSTSERLRRMNAPSRGNLALSSRIPRNTRSSIDEQQHDVPWRLPARSGIHAIGIHLIQVVPTYSVRWVEDYPPRPAELAQMRSSAANFFRLFPEIFQGECFEGPV